MWDIVLKIWLCLLIAAVLGGIIGWLLKSLFCKKKHDEYEGYLSERDNEIARLKGSLSKVSGDANAENTKDDAEIAALRKRISILEGDLVSCNQTRTSLEGEVGSWKTKANSFVQTGEEAAKYKLETGNELSALKLKIVELQDEVGGWKTKAAALTAAGAAAGAAATSRDDSEKIAAQAEIGKLRARIGELEGEVRNWSAKASEASTANGDIVKVRSEADSQISELRSKLTGAEKDLKICHDRQVSLEDELKSASTKAVALSSTATSSGEDTGKLRAEIDNLKSRLSEVENEKQYLLSRVKKAESGESIVQVVPMDKRDDLELIHGVGPVLERMLYDMGIYFFKDIAGWDAAKIEDMNEKLPNFRGRIEREGWVESAKEEHFKKYGERL